MWDGRTNGRTYGRNTGRKTGRKNGRAEGISDVTQIWNQWENPQNVLFALVSHMYETSTNRAFCKLFLFMPYLCHILFTRYAHSN